MSHPDTALPVLQGNDPTGAAYQIVAVQNSQDILAKMNAVRLGNFNVECANWTQAAGRDRDMGLPIPAKPEQPASLVLNTDGPDDRQIIWEWVSTGPLLGSPCPDLPPVPTPPSAGHVHVGTRIFGNFFRVAPDDGNTNYGQTVTATSDDGVSGTFRLDGAAVGRGWYELVS